MTSIPRLQVHATYIAHRVAITLIILLPPILFGCAQKSRIAPPLTRFGTIAAGGFHTCALTDVGGIKCWGGNSYGQLGDGSAIQRNTPVDVVGLTSGVKAIAGGGHHTCALTEAGGIRCWGSNDSGQLGDGMTLDRSTPVDVVGLARGVRAIATGGHHTCAITEAGGVKCWGDNDSGQLGDETRTDRHTPVDVVGLTSGAQMIAAGGNHTCVLTNAGGVKCWGDNSQGQLGNGLQSNSTVPVNVAGLMKGVTMIASGVGSVRELELFVGAHTCALTTTRGVKCWGDNDDGQLGEGRTVDRDTPVDVVGLTGGVKAIAAGAHHSCALTTEGNVKCWGDNSQGQLGNGTTTDALIPVDVMSFWHNERPFLARHTQRFQ